MKYLYLFFLGIILGGCTQNNGHIGNLFGQWQLKEIVIDNNSNKIDGTLFICFQNKVVLFRKMAADSHGSEDYVGMFAHIGDSLYMDLSHGNSSILNEYNIEDLNTPSFRIKQLDKKHLILSSDDKEWIYRKF